MKAIKTFILYAYISIEIYNLYIDMQFKICLYLKSCRMHFCKK